MAQKAGVEQQEPDNKKPVKDERKIDTDSDSDSDEELPDYVKDTSLCWSCQSKGRIKANGKSKIAYAAMPCNCAIYCKGCAMKMATGGRCKRCGKMFAELRKI